MVFLVMENSTTPSLPTYQVGDPIYLVQHHNMSRSSYYRGTVVKVTNTNIDIKRGENVTRYNIATGREVGLQGGSYAWRNNAMVDTMEVTLREEFLARQIRSDAAVYAFSQIKAPEVTRYMAKEALADEVARYRAILDDIEAKVAAI
jgi:hypothetical protein